MVSAVQQGQETVVFLSANDPLAIDPLLPQNGLIAPVVFNPQADQVFLPGGKIVLGYGAYRVEQRSNNPK